MYISLYIYINRYIHAYIHAYIHTYIYIYRDQFLATKTVFLSLDFSFSYVNRFSQVKETA